MISSASMGAIALALVASNARAFVISAGAATSRVSSTTPIFSSSYPRPTGRSMSSPAKHRMGCTCVSCSSRSFLGRARSSAVHGCSCQCGSCVKQRSSAMLMKAHCHGCGCGECSASVRPRAFHDGPSQCPSFAPPHGIACPCAACAGVVSWTGRRVSSSLMSMGVAADQTEGEALLALRHKLDEDPDSVALEDTMSLISEAFVYTPKRFMNGAMINDAGVNEGSCKVFSFGKLAGLSAAETLACFGEHYRSVLADPAGGNHGNIRAFMETGWGGISFPDGLGFCPKGS